jgi:hypothetical protein
MWLAAVATNDQSDMQNSQSCWVIKRGAPFQPFDFDLLPDLGLAWGFQVNFMYDPVR